MPFFGEQINQGHFEPEWLPLAERVAISVCVMPSVDSTPAERGSRWHPVSTPSLSGKYR
jgi:hypothetical protein